MDCIRFLPIVVGRELDRENARSAVCIEREISLPPTAHISVVYGAQPTCRCETRPLKRPLNPEVQEVLKVDRSGDLVHHRALVFKRIVIGREPPDRTNISTRANDLPGVAFQSGCVELGAV